MTVIQEPPIIPTTEQLVEKAIELLQEKYPNWKPNPASPEYRMFVAFAAIASQVAFLSQDVPEQIIQFVGAVVYRVQIRQAKHATVKSTWIAIDEAGHPIPAATKVYVTPVGGSPIAFEVKEESEIEAGHSEAEVELVAVEPGEEGNGLNNTARVVTSEPLAWVDSIVLLGESSEGTAAESLEEYTQRILELAELISPRPILAPDFAAYVRLLVPGKQIARAVGLDEYDPETANTFTGTVTEGSNELKEISSFEGLTEGSVLKGTGIPTNTVVVSVDEGAETAIMSSAATASHSKESIEALGSYGNERCVTVACTNAEGDPISSSTKEEAETLLKEARESSFKSFVIDATYTEIEFEYEGVAVEGFKPVTVEENVAFALANLVSPIKWGVPASGDATQWINNRVLRYQDVITCLNNTLGFDHYTTLLVNGGTSDVYLAGVAPLTKLNKVTGTVVEP